MNSLEKEQRHRLEAQERGQETREAKEGEIDEELKVAAAKERADFLVKEVKSAQQSMKNIVVHMQQVQQAIAALRAQLQLTQNDDAPSVAQDQQRIQQLQGSIIAFQDELEKMRDDLVREKMTELQERLGSHVSASELKKIAEQEVEKMIRAAQ